MKNIALIFAGGTGSRLSGATTPKQFLVLSGKPIIIHTLEYFQLSPGIDSICVVCLESRIPQLKQLIKRFDISKVNIIVPGGATGMDSIFNGLKAIRESERDTKDILVLLHDGVRPLIDTDIIENVIECARENGNAVTVSGVEETIMTLGSDGRIADVVDRSSARRVRAPQAFFLEDLYSAHVRARKEGYLTPVDSATLMHHYGATLHPVEGPIENIKITTASDFYMARAILDARENSQIFGL